MVVQDFEGVAVEDADHWAITFRSAGDSLVFGEGAVGE